MSGAGHPAASARADDATLGLLRSRFHEALDAAVAAAYGWADYSPAMADEEVLRRLLALNLARVPG